MAKDPAFLFYYQDFLVGIAFMSAEEVGLYITILCHMADKGRLSEEHVLRICSGYVFTDVLKSKFLVDENGKYFHKRLECEVQKRRKYTESRRNNATAHAKHMENENENVNVIKKETKNKIKKYDFESIWSKYPKKIGKKEAFGYFNMTVKTDDDFSNINKAIDSYIKHIEYSNTESKYIKAGCNWFDDWEDWITYKEPISEKEKKDARDNKINKSIYFNRS